MTVIALINHESDPHLIADCLITSDGQDKRASKSIWVPSLGVVQTDWRDLDGPFHLVRMARKTIALPNGGGMLAFAGDCQPAFEFWVALSDAINTKSHYDPSALVDHEMLDRVLISMGQKAKRFHVLGVLIDGNGQKQAFIHRSEMVVETENFGTCYLAGSGSKLLQTKILQEDVRFTKIGEWIWDKISPTEELSESLCSSMLYYESDASNGRRPDTPIHERFGGFYEWYGFKSGGAKAMPPRLDLNLCYENDKLYLTRLHLSETYIPDNEKNSKFKSPQVLLSILTFCCRSTEVDITDFTNLDLKFLFTKADGVLIERFVNLYDTDNTTADPRISGTADAKLLEDYFETPFVVNNVRLIITVNGMGVKKGIWQGEIIKTPATVHSKNGIVSITLDENICLAIADILHRHM
ncbi:hypothetical protein IAI51_22030 [Pseudomonas sp. N40(2020)]|uniref:hypothetical protein n=1 Tax=Pseudomonas sp. N40(2020) TaxID=2767798 RepID=UPI0016574E8F|nr:hypothetical protein [Pseudomonas sp. N40(2020)]MBC8999209.1 hypothetical protein [Pseudomonas sp. N40(2020)]